MCCFEKCILTWLYFEKSIWHSLTKYHTTELLLLNIAHCRGVQPSYTYDTIIHVNVYYFPSQISSTHTTSHITNTCHVAIYKCLKYPRYLSLTIYTLLDTYRSRLADYITHNGSIKHVDFSHSAPVSIPLSGNKMH